MSESKYRNLLFIPTGILVLVGAATIVDYLTDRREEEATRQQKICESKEKLIAGRIFDKSYEGENPDQLTLVVLQANTLSVYDAITPVLWEYVEPGDSVFKPAGTFDCTVIKSDSVFNWRFVDPAEVEECAE